MYNVLRLKYVSSNVYEQPYNDCVRILSTRLDLRKIILPLVMLLKRDDVLKIIFIGRIAKYRRRKINGWLWFRESRICIRRRRVFREFRQVNNMSIDWLLNDIFNNLDRGYLLERRTRQQVVNYFNTVIEDFRGKNQNSDGKEECKEVVRAALKFHQKSKTSNSEVCLLGKYHDLLYVAAKLCHQWDLEDNQVVSELLTDIYACEKTFEKLFECAIFGTKVTQLISGWRSDYSTQDENVKASMYFLEHASKARLRFPGNAGTEYNFVDVPMTCYEKLSPLKAALKAEKWDIVNLLLKNGAITYLPFEHAEFEKYSIFRLFVEKMEICSRHFCYYPPSILESFTIFMRSVPHISSVCEFDDDDARLALEEFFDDLGIRNVREPESLRHLAKCAARLYLSQNRLLPARLNRLPIPGCVRRYIDLEED